MYTHCVYTPGGMPDVFPAKQSLQARNSCPGIAVLIWPHHEFFTYMYIHVHVHVHVYTYCIHVNLDMTLRCLLETMSKSCDHQEPMGFQNSSDVTLPHHGGPTDPPDAKRSCPAPPPATPSPALSPSHTNTPSIIPPPPPSLPHTNHLSSPSPISHKLRAIVIALCCHHRCTWSQLAGTEWLHGCGFSPVDVHLITKMTSWAVCGVRGPEKGSHDLDKESHDLDHDNTPFNDSTTNSDSTINSSSVHHVTMATGSTHHPPSYHPHPREPVGLTCKRLLDLARLHYLKTRGWDGRLVHFVSRGTSLENVLLIATPPTE